MPDESGEQGRRSVADEHRQRPNHDGIGEFAESGSVLGQDFCDVLGVGQEVDEGEGACKTMARTRYVYYYTSLSRMGLGCGDVESRVRYGTLSTVGGGNYI